MNLLITNTQEEQPYLILRSLVEEADRVVVTISGDSLFQRWAGMSQWSRFVSKRYRVPDCAADWRSGLIQPENTPAEARYIQRIEEICKAEAIDVIFPSYDAEVYVFAKNKERLAAQGIVAVVQDYESLTSILDKSLTLAAAEKVGFPIPRTFVPADREALAAVMEQSDPPWVLKPRLNAHGVNIVFASDQEELASAFRKLSQAQARPIVQEYVPSTTKRNFYLVVNRDSEIVSLFSPEVQRTRKVGVVKPCAAVISTTEIPFVDKVQALLRELGVWGTMTLQTVIDDRDGTPKLMEINPRVGHNLWYRTVLGLNEPLIAVRLARGQDPGQLPAFREGVLLLDPLWDFLHLLGQVVDQSFARIRALFRGAEQDSGALEKESIRELLRDYRAEYFTRRPRVTSPLNRDLLTDPLPPIVRIIKTVAEALIRRAR
ncbi:MAG: ATP-grasp domain-containing protein [Chromatiales bacterium]|nr:MAG: ATP-grasp domain-containing protein [Chromatiales bacterium]